VRSTGCSPGGGGGGNGGTKSITPEMRIASRKKERPAEAAAPGRSMGKEGNIKGLSTIPPLIDENRPKGPST